MSGSRLLGYIVACLHYITTVAFFISVNVLFMGSALHRIPSFSVPNPSSSSLISQEKRSTSCRSFFLEGPVGLDLHSAGAQLRL